MERHKSERKWRAFIKIYEIYLVNFTKVRMVYFECGIVKGRYKLQDLTILPRSRYA